MFVSGADGTGGGKRRDPKQGRAFFYGDKGGVFETVPYPEHTDALPFDVQTRPLSSSMIGTKSGTEIKIIGEGDLSGATKVVEPNLHQLYLDRENTNNS